MNKDTIYRQNVIDYLNELLDGRFQSHEEAMIEGIRDNVRYLPSAQQWIPCSERLPQEGQNVLITKESFKIKGYEQEVIKAKRSADPRSGEIEWWSPEFGTLTNKAVLAWMPLPEGYRGEQE